MTMYKIDNSYVKGILPTTEASSNFWWLLKCVKPLESKIKVSLISQQEYEIEKLNKYLNHTSAFDLYNAEDFLVEYILEVDKKQATQYCDDDDYAEYDYDPEFVNKEKVEKAVKYLLKAELNKEEREKIEKRLMGHDANRITLFQGPNNSR